MKKLITLIIFLSLTDGVAFSQSRGSFMVGAGGDAIKTDIRNFADKAQVGAELNYFLLRNFTVTGGFEYWSAQQASFVLGMRYYPVRNLFARFRGLIGVNQVDLGAGYSYPLNKNWKLEGIGDFYFDSSEFAFRIGAAYLIR